MKTKGNVIVEDIKVGDIHFEYDLGMEIRVEVTTEPVKDGDQWKWKAKTEDGTEINYLVTEGMAHYGPNLYDHQAYTGMRSL